MTDVNFPLRAPLRFSFLALLSASLQLTLQAQDTEAILHAARLSPTSRTAVLRAQIRGDGVPAQLTIRLKDHLIWYEFTDPAQTILLKLDPAETKLSEKLNGITRSLPPGRLHDSVRDTGVTYEDLSLGFLYWPRPVLQGEETVKTRPAWKIDLQAPSSEPLYGVARVWIDKESGAILRIEGYDKKGLLLRRFEIVSAQKIDGLWMLKQMRIESFEPGNSDPISRRYLEVLGKE